MQSLRNLKILLQDTLAKHKQTVRLIVTIFCAVLLLLAISRIATLNRLYPSPTIMNFSLNEEVLGGDIGITVTGFDIYEGEEIYDLIPGYVVNLRIDGVPVGIEQLRIVVCDVVITNHGTKTQRVVTYRSVLQVGVWSNAVPRNEYLMLNNNMSQTPEIAPGETITVRLPYIMCDFHFKNHYEWEHLIEKQLDLVLGVYPTRAVVHMR